jgi:hypothetical protein
MTAALSYKLFGAIFATAIVGWIAGLGFKPKPPTERAAAAAMTSWALCSLFVVLMVWLRTGELRLDVSVYFFPGAILTLFYLHRRYAKAAAAGREQAPSRP